MLLRDVDQLLQPGYLPFEMGCYRLPDNQVFLAIFTRMPGCKAKWVEWWYTNFLNDAALDNSDYDQPSLKKIIRQNQFEYCKEAKLYGKYQAEAKINHVQFKLVDPATYFNVAKIKASGVGSVICANSVFPDGSIDRYVIHVLRDTDYGCEMRSRFWMNNCTDEIAKVHMHHYVADMGYLADSLRDFIGEMNKARHRPNVACKFCFSDKVVKNGVRNNTQYWLCRNCGRGFVNNRALPKMKYSLDTISKAVHDYCNTRSLMNVRKDIEKDSHILPSNSTIYGWVKKLGELSPK